MPDITMLAPIARLLGISLDTLLSFHEDLTPEEITRFVYEMEERFKHQSYQEVFQWAQGIIKDYPNCAELLLQMAAVLDAQRFMDDIPDAEKYDEDILSYYLRALESGGEDTRTRAADALYSFYYRKEQYDKAEECLSLFSVQNPERKRKQAQLYQKTGRIQEAYKAFEELLFSDYQMASATLYNLYMLAMQENDLEKAHNITQKQSQLAVLFDMGKYYEVSCRLELATSEQDIETVVDTMQEMLANIDHISDFQKSSLYEHMDFKKPRKEFLREMKENLITCFCDKDTFYFLKDDPRWIELTKRPVHIDKDVFE